jgi:hypothetical protein
MSDIGAWPKDEVAAADEKTTLLRFLHHQRSFLERKVTGVSDQQARTPACPPSDLTLLGLVRHLTDVERGWSQRSLAGRDAPPLYASDDDPDADFHPPAGETLASALERFWIEVEEAEVIYQSMDLDDIERRDRSFYTVRWVLVHLIEEYARHLGHADLIRQAIDGQTGE